MSNNLKELIDIVQFKLKVNQEEIAKRLGYSRGHLSTLIKSNDPSCIQKVKIEFADILQNHTEGNNSPQTDFTAETIRDLAKSSMALAEANKVLAEANRRLADNNTHLIQKVNSAAPKQNDAAAPVDLLKTASLLAQRFELNVKEVAIELGRILAEDLLARSGLGISHQ